MYNKKKTNTGIKSGDRWGFWLGMELQGDTRRDAIDIYGHQIKDIYVALEDSTEANDRNISGNN